MPHTFCTFQKTDNGLIVNLEMQQFWNRAFPRRSQMYLIRTASRFLKKEPRAGDLLYAISLTVLGCDVPQNTKLPAVNENSIIQFIYVALNELIEYTMAKDITDYTAKDFWIRFLSNYAEDKASGMLKKLCALEEGLEMAEAALFTVTEEERRIARELSREHYYDVLADERAEAREEGLVEERAEGRAEGLEKGAHQTKLETAARMKNRGYDLDEIFSITGVTKDILQTL